MKNISTCLIAFGISAIMPIVVLFSMGMVLNAVVVVCVALVSFIVGIVISYKEFRQEENEKLKIIFDTLEKSKESESE